jgi:hypothetical protein
MRMPALASLDWAGAARSMQRQSASPIPGGRIGDYRNSKQRFVRLYGLGPRGASVASDIGRAAGPNVAVKSGTQPAGWREIAGDMPDPKTNMVVIVCGEGDQALFKADDNKPDSLVTFVVLQKVSNALIAGDENFARARNQCDLFVTTSDTDYVSDLIDNLAS